MSQVDRIRAGVAKRNEVGQLYVLFGILGMFLSILVPIVAVVPVYCGYKLIAAGQNRAAGGALIGVGLFMLVLFILELAAVSTPA